MIIGIHQPNYLPYLGFFDKMKQSDIFVIYDDAQFSKEDFHHRNKIRIYQGWKWLTVPVEKKRSPINEIKIMNEASNRKGVRWMDSHLNDIRNNYKDADFFKCYKNEIERIYKTEFDLLVNLNVSIIMFLKNAFNIDTRIVSSTDLIISGKVNPDSRSTVRILEILDALGGDVYLSGAGGHEYIDASLFEKRGIKLEFQDFIHPVYRQQYKGFMPHMAAIDALFNIGEMPE